MVIAAFLLRVRNKALGLASSLSKDFFISCSATVDCGGYMKKED
jgi:hypothetical protein